MFPHCPVHTRTLTGQNVMGDGMIRGVVVVHVEYRPSMAAAHSPSIIPHGMMLKVSVSNTYDDDNNDVQIQLRMPNNCTLGVKKY